jgi:PIN domain nuclease of toxin-antitoxin system
VYVLDASAVLAHLNKEQGWERVPAYLDDSVLAATTYVEIATKMIDAGATLEWAEQTILTYGVRIVDVSVQLAKRAAALPLTRARGLSIGERICLATAEALRATAVTADRAWADLDTDIAVELIR